MCTPIEAILRSPAHTPVYSRPSCERGRAVTPASPSASTIARSIAATNAGHVAHAHDRVADELAGAVVGQLAAARAS